MLDSTTVKESRWQRLRDVLRAGRRDRLDRKEQLSVVGVSNAIIFASVWLIMTLMMDATPPTLFNVGEALIIGACGALTMENPPLRRFFKRLAFWAVPAASQPKQEREVAARNMLLLAFALQFAALWPLLKSTGGAIDSPFGQMAVAFAIFAPFIANNWVTSLTVLLTTIAYYGALVGVYGYGEDVHVGTSFWAYFFVNVMILVLAVVVTVADLIARDGAPVGPAEEPPSSNGA